MTGDCGSPDRQRSDAAALRPPRRRSGGLSAGLAVRTATPDDVNELVRLENQAFADPWTTASLSTELGRPESTVLVAFLHPASRTAIGYASFRRAGVEAELLRVAVLPRCQGRGVGRVLLRTGLETVHATGAVRCFLEVRPHNRAARRLYESLGFIEVGRRHGYYGDGSDALIYVRVSTG